MNIVRKIYTKMPTKIKNNIKRVIKKDSFLTKDSFCKELSKYIIISFDIFDTLVTRKIYEPDDIFKIVEQTIVGIDLKEPFIEMRKKSELHANQFCKHDVNIDEIYFSMKELYNLTEDEINGIKGVEVELEKRLITPRREMLSILETLVKNKKKVVLTSDMYLNKYIIVEMLKKCGYIEGKHYHKIYLSNEKNYRKDNGTMWKYLKILYGGLKFIHVGDNYKSDYEIPMSYGLKAICLPNSRTQFQNSLLYNYLKECESISDSLYLGYIINTQIFNSPFDNSIIRLDTLSRVHTAPIIYEFLKFIENNSFDNERLLFLAREGYNLQRLYSDYCKLFNKKEKENYYFLASRKATMSSLINSEEEIIKSLNKEYRGSIKTLLRDVYDVEYKGIDTSITLPDDIDRIKDKVLQYSDKIINKSKEYKDNYLDYINELLDKKENMVIVDLGYSGTIQFNLSRMLGLDLKGLYLTNSDSVKKYSKKSKLLFTYNIEDNKEYLKIYHYSLILEYFLSAPFGQLQYFDKENNRTVPIYNDEVMDENKKNNISIIYDAVLDYFKYIEEMKDIVDISSKELVFNTYRGIVESNIISKAVKDKFDFMDSFNDSVKKNVFKIISKY